MIARSGPLGRFGKPWIAAISEKRKSRMKYDFESLTRPNLVSEATDVGGFKPRVSLARTAEYRRS